MKSQATRHSVDLSAYPDLIVIYLGMRVNSLGGIKTLLSLGRKISQSVASRPDGLLRHEPITYSIFPPHLGMRQYWRDFDSLETWARSLPHQHWWQSFLRDTGGTGFWHEAYSMRGGMEAVYVDIPAPLGFTTFAKVEPAHGSMFSARQRLRVAGEAKLASAVTEEELAEQKQP